MSTRFAPVVLALLFASILSGCGAMEQAQKAADHTKMAHNLKQLGVAYHNYLDAHSQDKAPTGWQDLRPSDLPAEVQQQLEGAGYTVNWGLDLKSAKNGTSNTILAHHPNAATEGGQVLLLDGSVQQLTGAEVTEKLAAQNAP